MTAPVPRQERQPPALQGAQDNGVGGLAERVLEPHTVHMLGQPLRSRRGRCLPGCRCSPYPSIYKLLCVIMQTRGIATTRRQSLNMAHLRGSLSEQPGKQCGDCRLRAQDPLAEANRRKTAAGEFFHLVRDEAAFGADGQGHRPAGVAGALRKSGRMRATRGSVSRLSPRELYLDMGLKKRTGQNLGELGVPRLFQSEQSIARSWREFLDTDSARSSSRPAGNKSG